MAKKADSPSRLKKLLSFGFGNDGDQDSPERARQRNWIEATQGIDMELEQLLRDETSGFGLKVHLITLSSLRAALGDDWGRRAGKIMLIADGVINNHKGRGSRHFQRGPDSFVLTFAKMNEREGRYRAQVIADDLGRRLIGEQFSGLGDVRIGVGEIDGEDLLAEDGHAIADLIDKAMENTTPAEQPGAPPPGYQAPDAAAADRGKTGGGKDRPGPDWNESQRDGAGAGPGGWDAIEHAGGGQDPSDLNWRENSRKGGAPAATADWQALEKERPPRQPTRAVPIKGKQNQAQDPGWEAAPRLRRGQPPGPSGLTPDSLIGITYRPTWNAASQSLDTFQCLPARGNGGEQVIGDAALPADADADTTLTLYQDIMATALRALRAMTAGHKATLIVPVPLACLSEAAFAVYSDRFTEKAKLICRVNVIAEIVGIPGRVEAAVLGPALERLRGMSRAILLRAQNINAPLAALVAVKPLAIGFDLGGVSVPPESFSDLLGGFVQRAQGTQVYLCNAGQREDIGAAVESNFLFVNGSALKKNLDAPGVPVPVSRDAMLKLLHKRPEKKAWRAP